MGHRVEAEFTRIIDGKTYKVKRLVTGFGGRSISKAAFGGKAAKRIHTGDSRTERDALK